MSPALDVDYVKDIARRAIEEKGSMQKHAELAALLSIVRRRNPYVVWEIGTGTGGTLWAVAAVLGPGRVYVSIDLPDGLHGPEALPEPAELKDLLDEVAWPCQIEVIRGNSREVDLPETPGAPELLLIDGDHSALGVRADYERYAPLVAKGGLIALHDILEHSIEAQQAGVTVHSFWQELKAKEKRTAELADRDAVRPGTGRWGGEWGGWGIVYR